MQSMYEVFYNIWSSGFGEAYTESHPDMLTLLSTACVVMTIYGIFKLFVCIGKKVLPK